MKIEILSRKVVMSNDDSIFNYFGWPSVCRLKNGRLAMVASGFRRKHVCPFGKTVISYSENEGQTWTLPAPVIDTLLDDRDGGITAFGNSSVIVTSFNNDIAFQRKSAANYASNATFYNSYLDFVEKFDDWNKYLGSTFRISHDNGITFGEIKNIPVSCPHGPAEMPDGALLYVGHKFDLFHVDGNYLSCYKVYPDGTYEFMCEIENVGEDLVSCEPHTIVLKSGKILVHIRVERQGYFTIYQSESLDGGKSFSKPHRLLDIKGGAPAHIIQDGDTIISTYGYRNEPYGIRAMFSHDEGETWETDQIILDDAPNGDLGYPSSVVLADGSILTVFYMRSADYSASKIMQVIWRYSEN
jgi:hypothetical protein